MAFCSYCGTAVPGSVAACPQCGHPQTTTVPASAVRRTERTAVASLVLGIVGLVMCPFVPSIIAVILGSQARAKIAADPNLDGDALAKAGVICGWVGIALTALLVVGAVLLLVFADAGNMGSNIDFSV